MNYAHGLDEYCISIGLLRNEERILGVIFLPSLNKLFVAEKGKGATLNGKKIHVSDESELSNMIAATDNSSNEPHRSHAYDLMKKVSPEVRCTRIFGSCAIHSAYVAEGKFDFYFKSNITQWDFAAGILIAEEAGGLVTDFDGNKITKLSKNIVISNNKNHKRILEIFKD